MRSNTSNFMHRAKVARPTTTQTETGGDPVVGSVDVVEMRVKIEVKRSEEKLVSGAFRGCDYWKITFQKPGWTVQIAQGDHITVYNYHGADIEFIIDGYFPPNDEADDFYVICETQVAKTPC